MVWLSISPHISRITLAILPFFKCVPSLPHVSIFYRIAFIPRRNPVIRCLLQATSFFPSSVELSHRMLANYHYPANKWPGTLSLGLAKKSSKWVSIFLLIHLHTNSDNCKYNVVYLNLHALWRKCMCGSSVKCSLKLLKTGFTFAKNSIVTFTKLTHSSRLNFTWA